MPLSFSGSEEDHIFELSQIRYLSVRYPASGINMIR
jgi:hypothetical protein